MLTGIINSTLKNQMMNIINKLDHFVDQAIKRIRDMNPKTSIFGLGLSGGLDSRVVAYYAKKNNLPLKTFIFGEENLMHIILQEK